MVIPKESNSSKTCKIALGTVQFGQKYGISNLKGQPDEKTIKKIFDLAAKRGVTILDTAPAYGMAEIRLGNILGGSEQFEIITKTCTLSSIEKVKSPSSSINQIFEQSLTRLKIDQTFGLLVHLADDLLGPYGDDIWKTLEQVKASGHTKYIGASCYNVSEARTISDRYPIDIVQLPLNIFDQSLISSGTLNLLSKRGVMVHARSVFLQGLLLMKPNSLPEGFEKAKPALKAFIKAAQNVELSPLELSIQFVNSLKAIDQIVIGVENSSQLIEIFNAVGRVLPKTLQTEKLEIKDSSIINPSIWPPDNPKPSKFDFTVTKDECSLNG